MKKIMKRINLALIIIAAIAVGFAALYIPLMQRSRKYSGKRIDVEFTSIVGTEMVGTKHVMYADYIIKNNTKTPLCGLDIRTKVYDTSGEHIGDFTVYIGSSDEQNSDFLLNSGEETELVVTIDRYSLSYMGFAYAYENGYDACIFEISVSTAFYTDGKMWDDSFGIS